MAELTGLSSQLIFQKALDAFNDSNFDKSESYLMYLVRQTPFFAKSSAAFNLLGLIYHEKNKFNQAIKFFRKSLEVNSQNSEARVNLSITLCDLGLYRDAEEIFSSI
jgi:tetratricopeptide (TPR) repeat protein